MIRFGSEKDKYVWRLGLKLNGKRALITGSSQGFGFCVAQKYVMEGASVMLCARGANLLEESRRKLQLQARNGAKIFTRVADISRPDDVDATVVAAIEELGGLDILIANAGVHGPKGPVESCDWAEWREAIEINLFGSVYCCRAVVPYFKNQRHGKIILLSGGGATKPMPFVSAYAASKAAIVRFGETLSEELLGFNIDVNAVAPGAMNTRLLDDVLLAGPDKLGRAKYDAALKQRESGGDSPQRGADLCVFLGSEDSNGITGKLISAIWDPWTRLCDLKQILMSTDIYTLRRIVPKDRNLDWGDPI